MNRIAISLVFAAATASCAAHAERSQSKTIVVESPADLPAMAQTKGADMFLHEANDGSTYLYVEAPTGQSLAVLDVTDPGAIRGVAEIKTGAQGPFQFLDGKNPQGGLIQYRDGGLAVLDLSKYDRPAISQTPQLAKAGSADSIGVTGLLLTENDNPAAAHKAAFNTYDVLDTSRHGAPSLLASVPGVTRRVTKADTGTVFLLADNGVTVVRDLRAEEARALDISAAKQ